jgi:hypothetical protein
MGQPTKAAPTNTYSSADSGGSADARSDTRGDAHSETRIGDDDSSAGSSLHTPLAGTPKTTRASNRHVSFDRI